MPTKRRAMTRRRWQWALVVAILVVPTLATTGSSPAGSNATLYAARGQQTASDLFTLDPASGAVATDIGPTGYGITGLAFSPVDGQLYGATTFDGTATARLLVRIDPASGATTVVGPFGVQAIADLAFGPDGTLYGWVEPNSDDLATIDVATGAATIVGDSGISTFGGGLAYDVANDRLLLAGDGANGELYGIDPATGAATVIATLNDAVADAGSALEFDCEGTLYAALLVDTAGGGPARLATIDPTTGSVTALGESIVGLDALAWSCAALPPPPPPEPPAPGPAAPGAATPVLVQPRFTG